MMGLCFYLNGHFFTQNAFCHKYQRWEKTLLLQYPKKILKTTPGITCLWYRQKGG